jgi:hypothetical protein
VEAASILTPPFGVKDTWNKPYVEHFLESTQYGLIVSLIAYN